MTRVLPNGIAAFLDFVTNFDAVVGPAPSAVGLTASQATAAAPAAGRAGQRRQRERDGSTACALVFDRPIALAGGPGEDGSVTVDGAIPQAVELGDDGVTLTLFMGSAVWPGAAWAIAAQPAWVATPLANPAGGTFS